MKSHKSLDSVGIIGTGKALSAVLQPAFAKNILSTENTFLRNRSEHSSQTSAEKLGVQVAQDIDEILTTDTLFLGIKPQDLQNFQGKTIHGNVIDLFSMTSPSEVRKIVSVKGKIAWIMPNLASEYGQGLTGVYIEEGADENFVQIVESVAKAGGEIIRHTDVQKIPGHTILSASMVGILAYFQQKIDDVLDGKSADFFWKMVVNFIQAQAENIGFSSADAHKLAHQTFIGFKECLKHESPASLQARVASRGGTTEAMLNYLEKEAEKICEFSKNKKAFLDLFARAISIGLEKAGFETKSTNKSESIK